MRACAVGAQARDLGASAAAVAPELRSADCLWRAAVEVELVLPAVVARTGSGGRKVRGLLGVLVMIITWVWS